MENINEKSLKKDCLLKNLQIVLWALLALLFATLLLLECIPAAGSTGVTVKESVTVSSALINKTQQNYTSAISGVLFNPTDDVITVERVTVTVKGEEAGREVELEGFVLPPRTGQELYESWESLDSFTRVTRVAVTVDGDTVALSNANRAVEQGPVVVLGVLLAFAVFLLVRAAKGRYYLWQESKL